MDNLPPRLSAYLEMAQVKQAKFNAQKLEECLRALGYTFTTSKARLKFGKKRLKEVQDETTPTIYRIYLDYGKPTQLLLAEYNDKPEFTDEGEIIYSSKFYEPKTRSYATA